MIIYTARCLACSNKTLWKAIKAFAHENNLPIEERRIGLKTDWKQQAENYGVDLPFVVNGKTAMNLNEPLEGLL